MCRARGGVSPSAASSYRWGKDPQGWTQMGDERDNEASETESTAFAARHVRCVRRIQIDIRMAPNLAPCACHVNVHACASMTIVRCVPCHVNIYTCIHIPA
jgi:hypothetical protein